ncbi:uncharacterized protein K02A2.6-like [Topomyia yanbarensis]|uniref:uncharacterized protein K02A2.6-like n=1 Tax=Topomyia yanbarensis TaxID=2498891 RepID=UPI00273AFA17|nr:uncharacterized protein K02A2.6-like [Topomyia yanbarensis]
MEGNNSPTGGDRSHPQSIAINGQQQDPAAQNHFPPAGVHQQQSSNPILRPPLLPSGQPRFPPNSHQQTQQQNEFVGQCFHFFQQLQQQQQVFFQTMLSSMSQQPTSNPEQILDSLASNIQEFRYEPDANVTFAGWYVRYEDLFAKDAVRLDDEAKVRLLLRKIGPLEHERYTSYILPKLPKDVNFAETVSKLKSLYGTSESVLSRRYRCLQVAKHATEDFKTYACRVNKLCVEFELGKLTEEQFKCLVFVCGLKAENDAEVRTRLLSRIEERADVTLEQISDECQRLLSIKHDTAMIEAGPNSAAVQALKSKQYVGKRAFRYERRSPVFGSSSRPSRITGTGPGSPCWNCGSMHYSKDCPFKNHQCRDCKQVGHKDGYCTSAKKAKSPGTSNKCNPSRRMETKSVVVKNVRKRRRFVEVLVNNRKISLQLDTASDISIISEKTWCQIGRPTSSLVTIEASTASGKPLKLEFQCTCEISINGEKRQARFYVVKQHLNLIGLDLIDQFNF